MTSRHSLYNDVAITSQPTDLGASDSVQSVGLDIGGDVVRVAELTIEVGLFDVRELGLVAELSHVNHLQTVVSNVSDDVGEVSDDLGITPRGGS
jgi:hypothetical protein